MQTSTQPITKLHVVIMLYTLLGIIFGAAIIFIAFAENSILLNRPYKMKYPIVGICRIWSAEAACWAWRFQYKAASHGIVAMGLSMLLHDFLAQIHYGFYKLPVNKH